MIEICFIEGSAEVEFAFDREGGKKRRDAYSPEALLVRKAPLPTSDASCHRFSLGHDH